MQTLTKPMLVVLDTVLELRELDEHIGRALPYLKHNRDGLTSFEMILEPLIHETDALANLSIFAVDLADEIEALNPYLITTDDVIGLVYEFGRELYHRLRVNGLYETGELAYEYHDWYSNFLVVKRKDAKRNDVIRPKYRTLF